MSERLQNVDRFQDDLSIIGLTQIDNRNWASEGYTFMRVDWRNLDKIYAIEDMQKRAWDMGDKGVVPFHLLGIVEEVGGDLLTVLDKNGKQQAFTLTFPTDNPGKMFLHMVGVEPEKHSANIGQKIMLLEGALARSKGVEVIEWTYDPLMGGNSQLYIAKLGARPYKYTVNKYGIVKNSDTGTESRYKDVPTDRFTVRWDIGSYEGWKHALSEKQDILTDQFPEWDGNGNPPQIFQVSIPFDFTKISTEQMMDARIRLRKIALKTMDVDDFNSRDYRPGTHDVAAFIKDSNRINNRYLFVKR